MANDFGLGRAVLQGVAIGISSIVTVAFIGNRVATTLHHQAEERLQADGPSASKMRTFAVSKEIAKIGEGHFSTCGTCHGSKGEGKIGVAPRLNSATLMAASSDEYLFRTIKMGRKGTTMIPFGKNLTDRDIESVVVYLRYTFKSEPAKLNEAPLSGSVDLGKQTYVNVCSGCHGSSGAGYQETANGTGIGRKGFLEKATNGFIRHIARHGKSGTQMKPMIGAKTAVANLTDEEIDSTIMYLRENQW